MSLLKYSASQCFPHYSIDYFDSDFTVLLRNYIAVGKELHGEETSWRIVRSLLIKKLLYSTSLAKINNSLSRPFDHYSLILSIYPGGAPGVVQSTPQQISLFRWNLFKIHK